MLNTTLDRQFANLFSRAWANPYFDLEQALCTTMESWMHQLTEIKLSTERISGMSIHQPISILKIFSWPGGELCACVMREKSERVYIYDADNKNLIELESMKPILLTVKERDCILMLNHKIAEHISVNELERLLVQSWDSTKDLEEEILLNVHVSRRNLFGQKVERESGIRVLAI